ncbi:hypothetical protein Baya_12566 [Bagarius yarrelli]|uniref:Uncharacterized protein n=1 Tax=Bagarius yarrelli TaxID=175774 RepID=A0A556V3K6_BAGYA|nr:hypothetical protein Baya_12566 [Bagarius yarrelli]
MGQRRIHNASKSFNKKIQRVALPHPAAAARRYRAERIDCFSCVSLRCVYIVTYSAKSADLLSDVTRCKKINSGKKRR